jgi:WD40 repeat protein
VIGKGMLRSFGATSDGARVAALGWEKTDPGVRIVPTDAVGLAPAVPPAIPGTSGAERAAISPDGARVVVAFGRDDASVDLYDANSGALVRELETPGPVTSLAWSADGKRFAAGTSKGSVVLSDAVGTVERTIEVGSSSIAALTWSPAADLLVVAGMDHALRVVRTSNGEVVLAPPDTIGFAADIEFSPDGSVFAVADQERVRYFDTKTWAVDERRDHQEAIRRVAFSPDGLTTATASDDQTIVVRTRGEPPLKLTGHTDAILQIAFWADGTRLVSGAQDGTARVWDLSVGAALDVLDPFGGAVDDVRFLSGDRVLAAGMGPNGGSVAVLSSPPADRSRVIEAAGAETNLRVCRATFAVVPLAPAPDAKSVWAPVSACQASASPAAPERALAAPR